MAEAMPAQSVPTRSLAGGPKASVDWTGALANSAIGAVIAALLCVPILTHVTTENFDSIKIVERWWILPVVVGFVFFGRLLLHIMWWSRAEAGAAESVSWRPLHQFALAIGIAVVLNVVASYLLPQLGWGELPEAVRYGRWMLLPLVVMALFRSSAAGEALFDAIWGVLGRYFPYIMLVIAILLPWMPFADRYIVDTGILIITYVMLGWGLNIVVGLAGLLDLGYVAFYAVGAYSYALLAHYYGLGFWMCLPLAGILAAFWGLILGFPVLRLRGDYLAIVTLAFGEIIRVVLLNWQSFTKGPAGISNIPRPTFFGLEFTASGPNSFAAFFGIPHSSILRIIYLYYIVLGLALITNWVSHRLRRLPVGRAWEALREDEIACRSLGINTTNTKLTAFAIGAMFGGFAGAFFATRQGFISPESFNFMESATILAIVVLGGLGSQIGIVIASVVMMGGIEVLRNLSFLKTGLGPDFTPDAARIVHLIAALLLIWLFRRGSAVLVVLLLGGFEALYWSGFLNYGLGNSFDPTQYRMLAFGVALVAIMVWKPRGIVSSRAPTVSLGQARAISGNLVKEGHG